MQSGDVSIVIPAYQSGHLLPACLAAAFKGKNVREVIVVDDGSTDNTPEVLKEFPVRSMRHERNSGPVAARNTGAKKASGKYILFVDSDIEIAPDYAATLASFMKENPRAAAVSGKVMGPSGGRIWYNFGYRLSLRSKLGDILFVSTFPFWGNSFLEPAIKRASMSLTLNFAPDKTRRVGWVIESAFMTPRKIFEELGGFDEGFFMFHEGPDYSERARALGYDTWYLPESSAKHLDLKSHAGSRSKMMKRSIRRYLRKHRLRLW